MASNETILAWKAELHGAESVRDGLNKINSAVKSGSITQTEANRVIQSATKDTRNFRAEQNLLTRSFMATHPQLNTLSRSMSIFGSVARTGLNIANSLNIMWIRQNQTALALADATFEVHQATRELARARKEGDPLKIAEAEERLNIALEKQAGLKTGDFWTNLTDVATIGLTVTTAVTTIFTNLLKSPTVLTALMKAGSFFGGIFSGFFTLAAKAIAVIADWLFPSLTGKAAMQGAAKGGMRTGGVFGLSFVGGAAAAIAGTITGVVLGAISFPSIDKILREKLPGYSDWADFREGPMKEGLDKTFGVSPELRKTFDEVDKGRDVFGGKGVVGNIGKQEDIDEQVSMWQPVIDLFTVTVPDALNILKDGFLKGWESITGLTNTFGAGLVSGVNGIFKSLIDSMNVAIVSYNRAAKKMGKSTISRLTFTPNSFTPIPMPTVKAATGFDGMINRPTLFLAGEAGPESVSISPNGSSSGGGITVVVNVQGSILTERELFRRVDENLKNELRKRNFRILQ